MRTHQMSTHFKEGISPHGVIHLLPTLKDKPLPSSLSTGVHHILSFSLSFSSLLFRHSQPLVAGVSNSSSMDLTFLGTSSAQPSKTRNHSAAALRFQSTGDIWLFDVGEATQHQLLHSSLRASRVSAIFITHLHGVSGIEKGEKDMTSHLLSRIYSLFDRIMYLAYQAFYAPWGLQ